MRDTVNLVRLGVPCVGLVHDHFEKLAFMQVRQLGMPDAPLLIYPQDLPTVDPADVVQNKAEEVTQQCLNMLRSTYIDLARRA